MSFWEGSLRRPTPSATPVVGVKCGGRPGRATIRQAHYGRPGLLELAEHMTCYGWRQFFRPPGRKYFLSGYPRGPLINDVGGQK